MNNTAGLRTGSPVQATAIGARFTALCRGIFAVQFGSLLALFVKELGLKFQHTVGCEQRAIPSCVASRSERTLQSPAVTDHINRIFNKCQATVIKPLRFRVVGSHRAAIDRDPSERTSSFLVHWSVGSGCVFPVAP